MIENTLKSKYSLKIKLEYFNHHLICFSGTLNIGITFCINWYAYIGMIIAYPS